jgi:hypothetical protein
MKKINLILFASAFILFSCSKDSPIQNSEIKKSTETIANSKTIQESDESNLFGSCKGLRDPAVLTNEPDPSFNNRLVWLVTAPGNPITSTYYNKGVTILTSPNNIYVLLFQSDGNLVLYSNYGTGNQKALWSSGTNGTQASKLALQSDGNLVLYNSTVTTSYWATGTTFYLLQSTNQINQLALQNDGNLVIYRSAVGTVNHDTTWHVMWASDTEGGKVSCHQ